MLHRYKRVHMHSISCDMLTASPGGCGRFFEGTAAQMYQNLRAIADLKAHTKVYVAPVCVSECE